MTVLPFKGREDILIACQTFNEGDNEAFQRIVAGTLDMLGLLRLELATYLKVTRSTLSNWSNGKHLPPRWRQRLFINAIARRVKHGMRPRIPEQVLAELASQALKGADMQETTLIEIWIKDAATRDSNIALSKAVEAIAANDPGFARRVQENRFQYILDASPGCVQLPPADAERVVNQLRSMGYDIETRDMSLAKKSSSAERSAARRDYLRGRSR